MEGKDKSNLSKKMRTTLYYQVFSYSQQQAECRQSTYLWVQALLQAVGVVVVVVPSTENYCGGEDHGDRDNGGMKGKNQCWGKVMGMARWIVREAGKITDSNKSIPQITNQNP